jgi:hypothetical protein
MSKKNKNRDSAVARHTDYVIRQEFIQAPFGRAFKVGGHATGKKDVSRKRTKQNLKKEFAY